MFNIRGESDAFQSRLSQRKQVYFPRELADAQWKHGCDENRESRPVTPYFPRC